jgi:hypothetical protein
MTTAAGWLGGTIKSQVIAAAEEGAQLRQAYGGGSLPGTEQGIASLFVVTGS